MDAFSSGGVCGAPKHLQTQGIWKTRVYFSHDIRVKGDLQKPFCPALGVETTTWMSRVQVVRDRINGELGSMGYFTYLHMGYIGVK